MDCSRIDELLVDYIYQELESAQVELFEAHLQGCTRCSREVTAFDSTRSMLASLPEEDPPPQISALLLQEAARAVQPSTASFWERLRQGLHSMVMHPAMTAAVTLVLVLGISFYVYKSNPPLGDTPRVDLPAVLEGDSPTATITMKDKEGAVAASAARSPKSDDRRAEPAGERTAVARANEDLDTVSKNKAGRRQVAAKTAPRHAAQQGIPEIATPGPARRSNVVASTRPSGAQAQQVIYGEGSRASGSMDNAATQKPVVMPPPASAEPAASPSVSSVAKPRARPLRKKARRMSRKGPGVWDDAGDQVRSTGGAGRSASSARSAKAPVRAARVVRGKSALQTEQQNRGQLKREEESKRADKTRSSAPRRKGKGFWAAKPQQQKPSHTPKPAPRSAPRPTVTRRPAPQKRPSSLAAAQPAAAQASTAGKKQSKQNNAQSFLFLGLKASKANRCQAALQHFNTALAQDRILTTRVVSAMRRCTSRMSEAELLRAQRQHQMLAGLLERDIKRAREARYASRKARARRVKKAAKKPTAKKKTKKKAVDAFQAAPAAK